MQLSFYKYHGNGNDFIIADNRTQAVPYSDQTLIRNLCNRNYGIGADGLMLLEDKPGYDFYMRYFNSDGREGSMCGNGGRCIVHFAKVLGIIDRKAIFSGIDGAHEAAIDPRGTVRLRLQDVNGIETDGHAYILNTGSPHYVIFTGNVDQLDVLKAGREVRYGEKYSENGINVNFVERLSDGIRIRTYERGVENETLACGTGSVAAALCMVAGNGSGRKNIRVETRGGILEVNFMKTGESSFSDIWLTGPVKKVFHGTLDTGDLTGG
jgi:diaminopimelate epimerase